MDRYEAEALLADKPEGSFLLRDSAQENYVFSVSFRRYSRSLHARIEETQHKFSFDCHDPGVHASRSIRGLLDYYKDPLSCMFFEPMLLFPILRRKPFSLQELARTVICDNTEYEGVSYLPIPKTLKTFLREYHYKHKFDSRSLELSPSVLSLPRKSEDIEEDSDNDNVVEDFEDWEKWLNFLLNKLYFQISGFRISSSLFWCLEFLWFIPFFLVFVQNSSCFMKYKEKSLNVIHEFCRSLILNFRAKNKIRKLPTLTSARA